jgi:hypothetical protein
MFCVRGRLARRLPARSNDQGGNVDGQTLAASIDAAHAALDEVAAKPAARNRSDRSADVLPGR